MDNQLEYINIQRDDISSAIHGHEEESIIPRRHGKVKEKMEDNK